MIDIRYQLNHLQFGEFLSYLSVSDNDTMKAHKRRGGKSSIHIRPRRYMDVSVHFSLSYRFIPGKEPAIPDGGCVVV
jgi:hypothetical protein